MSIDPVLAKAVTNPLSHSHDAAARANAARTQSTSIQPNSGMRANGELLAARRQNKAVELPQDEVQVQRDPQNQIVIKYLDGSGKVIFQVPSSQVLALQQAIERTLEQQAQSRTGTKARAESGAEGVRNGH